MQQKQALELATNACFHNTNTCMKCAMKRAFIESNWTDFIMLTESNIRSSEIQVHYEWQTHSSISSSIENVCKRTPRIEVQNRTIHKNFTFQLIFLCKLINFFFHWSEETFWTCRRTIWKASVYFVIVLSIECLKSAQKRTEDNIYQLKLNRVLVKMRRIMGIILFSILIFLLSTGELCVSIV